MKMNAQTLRQRLREGVVNFKFVKKDGTERHAKGTTCADHLPASELERERSSSKKTGVVTFYDMEAQGWRSLQENTTIELV